MKYILWIVVMPIILVLIIGAWSVRTYPFSKAPQFTVAFSADQARYLGFLPEVLLQKIITDYKPKHFRLQANWNAIEPHPGEYDFSELDKFVSLIKDSGATITLALGRKLPRWPECHDPAWLKGLRTDQITDNHFKMIKAVVEHFKTEPAITRWQLENEPMFAYGDCMQPNVHRLKAEIKLMKQLDDSRPILLTDSGELSSWWEIAPLADELGTTFYRVTWNPLFGYFKYPWSAYYYRFKAALVSPWVKKIIVSELQLEPWAPQGLASQSLAEAQNSLSLEQFNNNIRVFRQTGFPEGMLWGVEWWYYARDKLGEPGYWQAAQQLFN